MPGRSQPILDNTVELFRGHPCVGCHHQFNESWHATGRQALHVILDHTLEGLLVFPLRMLGCQSADTVQNEKPLKWEWLLAPERPIVIEDRDPFRHRHE